MNIAGYTLRLDGVTRVDGPNYQAARALIEVRENDRVIAAMAPEKRLYPAEAAGHDRDRDPHAPASPISISRSAMSATAGGG